MDHVVTIISSPGDTSNAPTLAISPEVHELRVNAYFTLKYFLIAFSNFKTCGPPLKCLPDEARYFDKTQFSLPYLQLESLL